MDNTSLENVKGLVTTAFKLYRVHFRTLSATAALILLPLALVGRAIESLVLYEVQAWSLRAACSSLLVSLFVLLPLSIIGSTLAQGAIMRQLHAILNEKPIPTPGEAWRSTMKRFFPLLFTSAQVALGTAVGCCLFFLPGAWFLFRCLLVTQVVVLEGRSGISALRRSSQLVRSAQQETLFMYGIIGAIVLISDVSAHCLLPNAWSSVGSELVRIALMPLALLSIGLFYHQVINRPAPASSARPSEGVPRTCAVAETRAL